jgi:RNA-binding protein MEX3
MFFLLFVVGCKIKALRAKTNTYIKTPVRGEEPVFVVTGRKEDVAKAKREILSAAEHFSQIRASRKSSSLGVGLSTGTGTGTSGPPASVPGHVTIQVRVPYRVVGLVVGPKGATIKRIQQQTHTYIVTPSRDKEPVFEVTGLPESVEAARREIEAHIAMRTGAGAAGGLLDFPEGSEPDILALRTNSAGGAPEDLLASFLKNGLGGLTTLNSLTARYGGETLNTTSSNNTFTAFQSNDAVLSNMNTATFASSTGAFSSCSSSSSSASSTSGVNRLAELTGFGSGSLWGGSSLDRESAPSTASIWSDMKHPLGSFPAAPLQRRASFSPPLMIESLAPASASSSPPPTTTHAPARRISSDPLAAAAFASSTSASPTDSMGSLSSNGGRRECIVCGDKEIVAALVPCGHNLFCLECAERVCDRPADNPAQCPACQQPVLQAIRILS